MNKIDINYIRNAIIQLHGLKNVDIPFTFYYDESNNIRKFYLRENSFNQAYKSNFVLGGIVYDKTTFNVSKLYENLNLQKSAKEFKLKHIAKGELLDCLKSRKLKILLQSLLESDLYIHYTSLNILYYSLVDIIDSAILHSDIANKLGFMYIMKLKSDLFLVAKIEIKTVIELLYEFKYPNIKKENVLKFITRLIGILDKHIGNPEFHASLESIKQILKESEKKGTLPYLMDETDYILLKDFSDFYMRPIYLFKNSTHIFDKENSIEEVLATVEFSDNGKIIKPYTFKDSISDIYIQTSDIFIGLLGKYTTFINSNSIKEIKTKISGLSEMQKQNLYNFKQIIQKSEQKNRAFLLSVASLDELQKMHLIEEMIKK